MRFDNGHPWAHPQSRVPTGMVLWLVGLGIEPVFGRPRQCTDNGVVERCHGVLTNWCEAETCADYQQLQTRLTHLSRLQRAEYPSCDGCSRLAAYPQLAQPRQTYRAASEGAQWDERRVRQYVAQFRFTRTVEKSGRITMMTGEYALGKRYAAQQVTVYLDQEALAWVVEDRYGQRVKTFPAAQLTYAIIANLDLVYRKHRNSLAHCGI
jgi:transposase InsO family protein